MQDETAEETGADIVTTLGDSAKTTMSPRDAALALAQHRWKRDTPQESPAAPEVAAADTESGEMPDAAPPEEATGELTETTDPVSEEPPIELPRSWAKDKADVWAKLDRDTQEYLRDHDSKASTEVRRTQNEAAEQRKAFDAERQQLEQARKQYEEALPMLLQQLQQSQMGEFSDIKTMADVERLAREDWPRYALWDAQQKKVAAFQQELQASQSRQAQEYQTKWAQFAKDEDAKFLERAPEMADKDKASKIANASVDLLKDIGFSESDLSKAWNGEASLSLRDHRMQLLIRDAVRYRQARAAIPKAQAKPVPQVQRPGTAPQRAPDGDARLRALEKRANESGNVRDWTEVLIARRSR